MNTLKRKTLCMLVILQLSLPAQATSLETISMRQRASIALVGLTGTLLILRAGYSWTYCILPMLTSTPMTQRRLLTLSRWLWSR